ncbi:transmembrane protein 183-like [Leptidea sinapis]|uniref:transmembrane protein 183-like n=1 Tax=Leptidea sinapis TaxID=189913 RepID=UPI0021220AAF|nr:transmembrane protein 183-like [Leptidea sinapis]
MPRRKGQNKVNHNFDFTLNDCANACSPVTRKNSKKPTLNPVTYLAWDALDDDGDIIEEIDSDGTKVLAYRKKRIDSDLGVNQNSVGNIYPEIVWYLISRYIKPECIGCFARINKATYAITKQESFWRLIYKRYCKDNYTVIQLSQIEDNYRSYGLRQQIICELYRKYDVFSKRLIKAGDESNPVKLIKRRCVSAWYKKIPMSWSAFFKMKKILPYQSRAKLSIIEEMGRIDANPEEDTKVLWIVCKSCHNIPPLMGMILSSVNVFLSQGYAQHKVRLGFNSGQYVSGNIQPECVIEFDTVVSINVLDWWHPKYPHCKVRVPALMGDENDKPLLSKDFFDTDLTYE